MSVIESWPCCGGPYPDGCTDGHAVTCLMPVFPMKPESILTDEQHAQLKQLLDDAVNHPPHYNAHPSGIECIQVVEHMGFCLGNAIKYIWRADLKADALEDLRKARWYLDREIARRETAGGAS